jgi:hypothetical protein
VSRSTYVDGWVSDVDAGLPRSEKNSTIQQPVTAAFTVGAVWDVPAVVSTNDAKSWMIAPVSVPE